MTRRLLTWATTAPLGRALVASALALELVVVVIAIAGDVGPFADNDADIYVAATRGWWAGGSLYDYRNARGVRLHLPAVRRARGQPARLATRSPRGGRLPGRRRRVGPALRRRGAAGRPGAAAAGPLAVVRAECDAAARVPRLPWLLLGADRPGAHPGGDGGRAAARPHPVGGRADRRRHRGEADTGRLPAALPGHRPLAGPRHGARDGAGLHGPRLARQPRGLAGVLDRAAVGHLERRRPDRGAQPEPGRRRRPLHEPARTARSRGPGSSPGSCSWCSWSRPPGSPSGTRTSTRGAPRHWC